MSDIRQKQIDHLVRRYRELDYDFVELTEVIKNAPMMATRSIARQQRSEVAREMRLIWRQLESLDGDR